MYSTSGMNHGELAVHGVLIYQKMLVAKQKRIVQSPLSRTLPRRPRQNQGPFTRQLKNEQRAGTAF